MKTAKTVVASVILIAGTFIGFQNCSGIGKSSSLDSQPQDPQAAINSAQQQVSRVMGGTLSTANELQMALLALQQLLQEIQSINTSNFTPALQQLGLQLIHQLTDDINQLNTQLAALNGGGSCSFDGQSIASGASVTAYQNSSVPNGQTCVSESRVCSNGQLSGSYTFNSCTVQSAPPPPPPPPVTCQWSSIHLSTWGDVIGLHTTCVKNGCDLSMTDPACNPTQATSASSITQAACGNLCATEGAGTSCLFVPAYGSFSNMCYYCPANTTFNGEGDIIIPAFESVCQ